MKPIAIFYHCLFYGGNPCKLLLASIPIISEQMELLESTGLLSASSYFMVGINGREESKHLINRYIPTKADCVLHGLECKNENLTIRELEKWLQTHKGWNVLYFHSKGASRPLGDRLSGQWRSCMMRHNILNWRKCVADLDSGYDVAGVYWMQPPATPKGQYIFAGTFWWAKSDYLLTLPSIIDRTRIKISGINAIESRYEAEVWIGNGPRRPKVKDYCRPTWNLRKLIDLYEDKPLHHNPYKK